MTIKNPLTAYSKALNDRQDIPDKLALLAVLLVVVLMLAKIVPIAFLTSSEVNAHPKILVKHSSRFLKINDYLFNGKEEKMAIAAISKLYESQS